MNPISTKGKQGFTLVEMLVVLGIIGILATLVITVLNPIEFMKKARDSRRMIDLQSLNKALTFAEFDNISTGNASTTYVSVPDDSGGVTTTCSTLGLPGLPAGWTYQCSNSTNFRKPDATGWVPVNFSSLITVPNPLNILPVDPINTTSTNLYYTYVKGSWELTALFESTSYQQKYASLDNGTSTVVYEIGNNLKITPDAIASRTNTTGGGGEGGKANGQACSAGSECSSGYCVNNYCCNVASCQTCYSCNTGACTAQTVDGAAATALGCTQGAEACRKCTAGTCGYYTSGQHGCSAGQTCNASGQCAAAGAACNEGDQNTNKTYDGNNYFCDSQLRMWSTTANIGGAATTYTWGGYGVDEPTDSCIGIADRPACNYCDNLTYVGHSDWVLPSCVSGAQNSNCILYQFGIDACGSYSCTPAWDTNAQADYYWSSTEYSSDGAWYVDFSDGNVDFDLKNDGGYTRCVRGQ